MRTSSANTNDCPGGLRDDVEWVDAGKGVGILLADDVANPTCGVRAHFASGRRESAVVVAVTGVRVMEVSRDEVVDVIAVRYRFVTATRPVDMALGVTSAGVRRRARGRIGRVDLDDALVHVAIVEVVEVAVVEVVDVVAMTDGEVAAVGAVDVIVIGMGAVAHDSCFFPWRGEPTAALRGMGAAVLRGLRGRTLCHFNEC